MENKLPRSRADEVLTENIFLTKQSFGEFNPNEIKIHITAFFNLYYGIITTLLIRPLISANNWRIHRVYTIIFFIFL